MTLEKKYDVIIIGSGLGGLICGAILSKLEKLKVLVLEKNPDIGGKIMSYGSIHNPNITEKEYRESLAACGYGTIIHSEPDFPTIMEKHGLFKKYILDTGWHQVTGGRRNRFSQIANYLGKKIPITPAVGFCYWEDGKFKQLSEVAQSWPQSSQEERKRVAAYCATISTAESHKYDHVDYQSFLEFVTTDKNVIEYYGLMGCYTTGVNCPTTASAGEIIRTWNMTNMAGMHFQHGGGAGLITGGFKVVANVFAEVILENGGEIRPNSRVAEILVDGSTAVGVRVQPREAGDEYEVRARTIINNIPPRHMGNVLPKKYWPKEFQERINSIPLSGLLGFIGLKEPLETAPDRRAGDFNVRRLPGTENLGVIGGASLFSWEQTSEIDKTRAPANRCLLNVWISLYGPRNPFGPSEITNPKLLETLIQLIYDFFRKQYPQWDDVYEWGFFTRTMELYGMLQSPGNIGDRRLPTKHPTLHQLFYTGEDVETWGIGTDSTALSALLSVSAATGKDYTQLIAQWGR